MNHRCRPHDLRPATPENSTGSSRGPKTHRYQITDDGLRAAVFFTRAYNRLIRIGLAELSGPDASTTLRHAFARVEAEMDRFAASAKLAA